MAEDGVVPARQDRRHLWSVLRQDRANLVHAAMDPAKPPDLEPTIDGAARQAKGEKLCPCDNAMLPASEVPDGALLCSRPGDITAVVGPRGSRVELTPHTVVNPTLAVGDPPSVELTPHTVVNPTLAVGGPSSVALPAIR